MVINFCTLFDSNYLSRGLAMYHSLEKVCNNFHLYIFAFDDQSASILKSLSLAKATIVTLNEFEDEKLLAIKPSRNKAEYCWTCTPSTVLYVLQNYNVELCTYLDADIFFFSDPKVLLDEIGEKSVLITEHRYSKEHDQSKISGKYCVQFVSFRKNNLGLEVLKWWRERCIEWCFEEPENGKFGDQKYLDDWVTKFGSVHELKNLGGGVAPWNVSQYDFSQIENKIFCEERLSQIKFELVFYHFHSLKFSHNNAKIIAQIAGTNYKISKSLVDLVYRTYLDSLGLAIKMINTKADGKWVPRQEIKLKLSQKIRLAFTSRNKNLIKNIYHHGASH